MAFSLVVLKILNSKDRQTVIGLAMVMTLKAPLDIVIVLDQEFSPGVPKNKKLLHSQR